MGGQEKISLHGAPETMLATLYGRALDSRARTPVLGDDEAARTVQRIDYDFRRTGITRSTAFGVALRAKLLDDWTTEFLAAHPEATVLHLACGLDSRVRRVGPPPTVRWVDVDYPEVVELRERLLPPPPAADYRVVGTSVTDASWLEEVPADRPTAAVFEGLSMYLHKDDGKRLVQHITARFPSGQLLFDGFSSFGIRHQRLITPVRRAGATLHWAIDDPAELENWHAGLHCLDAVRPADMPGTEKLSTAARLALWAMAHTPGWRDVGCILRYEY
ncbi:class I SAM-dependent methyltransferase [Streptomyces sp. UNOC14_S4]|uniref:class I SAM-dependent methyltransferase n=1 Tax=Streptomyces sp. UNOC14_S4 TaxID=2872340 RepID=UPI001E3D4B36|nr:class I SAM-dependent methyltransferase [Streptomyces sp. UNOC14_S4]MCC3770972.1 class I SAM-dependent methyltransferase [Streptomyces sp. UNOC14_S4]